MTPIVSPTTNERKLRTLGLLGLFGACSGWFYYDGTVGWPEENIKKAVESLDPVPAELPPINPRISADATAECLREVQEKRVTRENVLSLFGAPGWERQRSNDRPGDIRYFGPGGMLSLTPDGDRIIAASYVKGKHDDGEIYFQIFLAVGLLPAVVGMVFQFVRVLTTQVTLSEDGLKVRARPTIPFDAMSGLDASRLRKKGFIDLAYTHNGTAKTVRLDDYVIRDFRPIIGEICSRCGFADPLPPPKAAQQPADIA